jgi:DNA-binding phage protein
MSRNTPQIRTLNRAVEICGGVAALAKHLGVSLEALRRWLDGDTVPTAEAYLKALDLVAGVRYRGPVNQGP